MFHTVSCMVRNVCKRFLFLFLFTFTCELLPHFPLEINENDLFSQGTQTKLWTSVFWSLYCTKLHRINIIQDMIFVAWLWRGRDCLRDFKNQWPHPQATSYPYQLTCTQQTQGICITFVQCWTNVEDVEHTRHLYNMCTKWYVLTI